MGLDAQFAKLLATETRGLLSFSLTFMKADNHVNTPYMWRCHLTFWEYVYESVGTVTKHFDGYAKGNDPMKVVKKAIDEAEGKSNVYKKDHMRKM